MITGAKMLLLLFLLCMGFSHFATNRLRRFTHDVNDKLNRTAALKDCVKKGGTLVTLYDDDDVFFADKFLLDPSRPNLPLHAWLGLRFVRNITWSDGTAFNASETPKEATRDSLICEAIDNDTRKGVSCSEKKFFMCYKDNNYTLIEKSKNWCKALQYCKKHFTNLASISNDTQKDKVIEAGKNTSFWIGVMHDQWQWEDKSCSTFRKWGPSGQTGSESSVILNSDEMIPYGDDADTRFFCSKGFMRIKVINESKTWEDALDYCRAEHSGLVMIYNMSEQEAVEEWLKNSNVRADRYWIGLRQSRVFGFWIWSDRTVNESKWKNREPPQLPMSNPCGVIETNNYTWSDEDCLVKLPFICEEEILFMN